MSKQSINLGPSANGGGGDDLRAGGDKINDNFNELYARTSVSITDDDYQGVSDGVTVSGNLTAINSAISDVSADGGGTVIIPGHTLYTGTIVHKQNVRVKGLHQSQSILEKRDAGDAWHLTGTGTWRPGVSIEDVTLDCGGYASTAGIVMEWVSGARIRRVKVRRCSVWAFSFGAYTSGASSDYAIKDLLLEDVEVAEHVSSSTYEAILIYNAQGVRIVRPVLKNATRTSTNGIGIYQVTDDVVVEDPTIEGWARGVYYSLSTNNTEIRGGRIEDCDTGISGAQQSDNGAFGATVARGLRINGTKIRSNGVGVFLGGVHDAEMTDATVELNEDAGIVVDDGQSPVSAKPENIRLNGCIVRNNNQSGGGDILHPGLLLQSVGGSIYLTVDGCYFYDDQGTATQSFPIVFTGAYTWDQIIIKNSRLSVYNGATSIALDSSAALGDNCQLLNCFYVSTTLPAKLQHTYLANSRLYVGGTDTGYEVIIGDVGPGGQAGFQFMNTDAMKVFADAEDALTITVNNTDDAVTFDDNATDGQTAMLLLWNNAGTLQTQRVSVGATDSGGSGYRLLRLPNS